MTHRNKVAKLLFSSPQLRNPTNVSSQPFLQSMMKHLLKQLQNFKIILEVLKPQNDVIITAIVFISGLVSFGNFSSVDGVDEGEGNKKWL